MKSTLAALLITGFSTVIAAQSLADLPKCAQGCVGSSVSVPGCQSFDIRCICSNRDWLQGVACCLAKACSSEEQANAVKFAGSFCATAGVTVPNQVTCPSAAAGSSSAASQSTASSSPSSESATSSAAPASSSSSSAGGYVMPAGNATTGGAATGTNTTTQTSSSPSTPAVTSNAAASFKVGAGLGLAGVVAAVVPLF
ncbi:MAG: hypothetical protein M1816_003312 [Peltula sp. TS41687]|nr:MAG: hypothetical protein M1816_003312 [Peltula sp. TS41687]